MKRRRERERKKLYELNRSIFITNKIIESTRVTRENWNKVQLLENNLTRLNYNGEREREREKGREMDAVHHEVFERKDYGGRFKPLRHTDAIEFHLLSMHEEYDLSFF